MDVDTPTGQRFDALEARVCAALGRKWQCEAIKLGKGATVDRLFLKKSNNEALGVAEVKCRDITLAQLESFGSYLISWRKIKGLMNIAALFGVPTGVIMHPMRERPPCVLYFPVADAWGEPLWRGTVEETETQATCNGGTAQRENAYIDLSLAKKIILPPREGNEDAK